MIELRNKETGTPIGQLTEGQLTFLVAFLEEEHDADQDYWLNQETITLMSEGGCDAELTAMLQQAMGERDELEIEWTKST